MEERIKHIVNVNAETGHSFAFVIDILDEGIQHWIKINFMFRSFESKPEWDFLVEVQEVRNKKITNIEEREFSDIDRLVAYLITKNINPDYHRAMHY